MPDSRPALIDTTLVHPAVAAAPDDVVERIVPSLAASGVRALDALSSPAFAAQLAAGIDPWARLRRVRELAGSTPVLVRVGGHLLLGDRPLADDAMGLFVDTALASGASGFRIYDHLNDLRNLRGLAAAITRGGSSFSIRVFLVRDQPEEGWRRLAAGARELGAAALGVVDFAALGRPADVARPIELLSGEEALPVELAAYGPLAAACSAAAAAGSGVTALDVALAPAGGGAGNPALETVAALIDGVGAGIDLGVLRVASAALAGLAFGPPASGGVEALRRGLPAALVQRVRERLEERGAPDRLDAALDEVEAIASELGGPPMSPLVMRMLAEQAALNVTESGRYLSVTQEIKNFLHGLYGTASGPASPDVRLTVIGREEPITVRPADVLGSDLEAARAVAGARGDGAVLIALMAPDAAARYFQRSEAAAAPAETAAPEPAAESEPPAPEPSPPATAEFQVEVEGETFTVRVTGAGFAVAPLPAAGGSGGGAPVAAARPAPRAGGSVVPAPMQGLIVKVPVSAGDQVKLGDVVAVLEAMKMQNDIVATAAGRVTEVHVREGEVVRPDQALVSIG